ncbi:MAG: Acyl-CoA dehydrogenase [Candidatus Carbobacillus altaicus]|uniref:Acyl-CoA dehydrogenase n=1 Tax=Candidatus Carbonibacillus altaicus TaxID=2163959 RepID=A0A2R6Y0H3_9BACL|nr:MAG: Acyl-CoA dehydrogenase [Candidatus Carbobacillus altaicus]
MQAISYAYGQNHFLLDPDLPVLLDHYLPSWRENLNDLRDFGMLMGTEAYETLYHIDHDAPPVLVMHDLDGNRIDRVRLSPAQNALMKKVAFINRPPYAGKSWHLHYAYGYLLADTGLYCIVTITNQTAYAIYKYAPEHKSYLEPLLSGEAYGATWMTESQGGSDLGANTTSAVFDEHSGIWHLTGDKYFASGAGLTDVAITTARPQGAPDGPKGLALFLLPRLNQDGLNYHVRRLKDKSATRAVPSGEVELSSSEAYMIGRAEEGIYYTLENLTVSRLANSIGAMGVAKKAHLEVLERVKRRRAFGKALVDQPLIRNDLTDLAVRMAGGLALTFYAIEQFDRAWKERPPYSDAYHYARFFSHIAKNKTAEHSAEITRMGMELFGGLGFLEEYAVARWHREALITPIWEGPSNIQALDWLETIHKKAAHKPYLEQIETILSAFDTPESRLAWQTIQDTFVELNRSSSLDEAIWQAKYALNRIADATQVALLYDLSRTGGERYQKLAALYARRFLSGKTYPYWAVNDADIYLASDTHHV